MKELVHELAERAEAQADQITRAFEEGNWRQTWNQVYDEQFARLIVLDFLSELTNDDSLGEARIETIKRLANKWGVERGV